VLGNTHAFAPEVQNAFAQIGRESAAVSFNKALIRGVFAGWLIAALVWMRAALDSGHIPLIVLITWLVAIGSFTHIIAGSIDVLFLVMTGVIPWMQWLTGYMLPVLIGNCLGGVSLVAVINHAQVFAGEQQKKV
jgi:formate-nitrite transporter family protein